MIATVSGWPIAVVVIVACVLIAVGVAFAEWMEDRP